MIAFDLNDARPIRTETLKSLRKKWLRTAMTTATVALVGHATSVAWAQNAPARPQAAGEVEEVVVTGSRIVREGYEAPTPLTVVGTEQLQNSGSGNLIGFLNSLPALASTATPMSSSKTNSSGSAGASKVNLRALGASRTLVLMDGMRLGAFDYDGVPNINTLPQQLIERVDIVTGGASAVYGSDAVAGVVNFVLDKKFTGIKGEVSGGVTNYGDGKNYKIDLSAGFGWGPDDRGHVLISGEQLYNEGITGNRPWNLQGALVVPNPTYTATNGQPNLLYMMQAAVIYAPGGTILTTGPLYLTSFGPGGTVYKTNANMVTSPYIVGGDWALHNNQKNFWADPHDNSQNLFTRISYDLTDNLNVFVQYDYTTANSFLQGTRMPLTANTVKIDNAYLPASVRTAMQANGYTQITIGTVNYDVPVMMPHTRPVGHRVNAGFEGTLMAFDTAWHWDANFSYNSTNQAAYSEEVSEGHLGVVRSLFAQSIDAVVNPANGQIVCRITLTSPTSAAGKTCKPWNIMGVGVNTLSGASFMQPNFQLGTMKQTVWAASITGEPFSLWAGPVSTAFSFEHRKDEAEVDNDPYAEALDRPFGSHAALHGASSVTEGAIETVIPLAKGESWAQAWDLSAAARFTGYELSGYTTTWKFGTTFAPIDDIKLRVTYSHDIRAANLKEAFGSPESRNGSVIDDFLSNRNSPISNIVTSNPNLAPESAHTLGAGVVLAPRFLDGFTVSVDYWDVNVKGAIYQLTSQNVVDACYTGTRPEYCAYLQRDPATGFLNFVTSPPVNLATQDVRGIDLEASYRTPMSTFVSDWRGGLALHGNMTFYLRDYNDTTFSPPINQVGTLSTQPDWKFSASATYELDPVSVTLTGRGISSVRFNALYVECASGCPTSTPFATTININRAAAAFYVDAAVNYKVDIGGADSTVYVTARNIFNRDPEIGGVTNGSNSAASAGSAYDQNGAVYRIGIRFKM